MRQITAEEAKLVMGGPDFSDVQSSVTSTEQMK